MTEIQKELLRIILQKIDGRSLLTIKEVSEITGRSIQSLQRDRSNNVGMPYKKNGKSKNSKIYYPISSVLDDMENNVIRTH